MAVGIAFGIFGLADLLFVLLAPGVQNKAILFLTSTGGAGIVLVTLPLLLSFFERQQDRIEGQRRELETLHAMDGAITGEMDLPSLLQLAVRSALRVVDAEAAGIALFHPKTGKLIAEEYEAIDYSDGERERLRAIARSGHRSADDDWDLLLAPLGDSTRPRGVPAAPGEIGAAGRIAAEPNGYLLVARRQVNGRPFTEEESSLLDALAATVEAAVANALAREAARDAERVREALIRERRVARALTEGLLPDVPAAVGEWRFARRYEPQGAETPVGGDIYDLFPLGERRYGVVIADVSGKGLPAARKTAMVKYSLRSYAREFGSPGDVLFRLNNALCDEADFSDYGFVTLIYGVLDLVDGSFQYASAGHETPILCRADGQRCECLEPTGIVLGADPDHAYRVETVRLEPGDGLLLYTDGLSEARAAAAHGEQLGVDGVVEMVSRLRLARAAHQPMTDLIWDAITAFTGGRMRDDTALLWVEREAAPAPAAPPRPARRTPVGAAG